MIPDADGKMHLIDLFSVEVPVEPLFDAEADTVFLLLTRRNPTLFQVITWTAESMSNSEFNPSHPTRFTVHGWNGDRTARVNTFVAEEYFQHGEYNVR